MKIERLTVRKDRHGNITHETKYVCTKLNEHYYLVQSYGRAGGTEEWFDSATTTNFDGQNKVNGVVRATIGSVDEKFELLIEYEGYKRVE